MPQNVSEGTQINALFVKLDQEMLDILLININD